MVEAWAADTAAGHDTALLAWRRQDVADLNRLARATAVAAGRVRGPQLDVDGRAFAAGDRIVLLAPVHELGLVTSERGTVGAVDVERRVLTARMDSGRAVALSDATLGADRLDHGYATTVHRFQGGTVDRAHVFAHGGGRELAYVAMSRARDRTVIHAVADSLDQAREELARDWRSERRPHWVIDGAAPAPPGTIIRPVPTDQRVGVARLKAERTALLALTPRDPGPELVTAERDQSRLRDERADLLSGTGRWADTHAGHAFRELQQDRQQRTAATWATRAPGVKRRDRRAASRSLQAATIKERSAQQHWERQVTPHLARLDAAVADLDQQVHRLRADDARRRIWLRQHASLAQRIATLDTAIAACHPAPQLTARTALRNLAPTPAGPQRTIGLGR